MSKKKVTTTKQQAETDSKKAEKEPKDIKAQFTTIAESSHSFISKYLLLFAVAISSVTIIVALLLSQHYINPQRDEQTYIEGESQITYKQIDKEKLETLQNSLESSSVEVETDFVPNRNNPFAE